MPTVRGRVIYFMASMCLVPQHWRPMLATFNNIFSVHQRLLLNLMTVSRTSLRLPDSVARTASQVFLIVKSTLKNIF